MEGAARALERVGRHGHSSSGLSLAPPLRPGVGFNEDLSTNGAAKHVHVSTKMTQSGSRVSDSFSRGVKADVASDKDLPYKCKVRFFGHVSTVCCCKMWSS
mmetsp:Transcript_10031/g.13108  ORF Transcript_10031/g.13108 Transcript_10031/m.13108 type:complete len:101 (-) Transcript_10031:31-333(-)